MDNNPEKAPERILTKDEVMEIIARFVENPTLVRELSDEQGLYILETEVESEKPGETIHYQYVRKGEFPDGISSLSTVIHIVHYEEGTPVGGHNVADYNYQTGEWEEVK